MKRREFFTFSAARQPVAACGAARSSRSGCGASAFLMAMSESDPEAHLRVNALYQGLQKLGWTEGRNIRINYRWPGPIPTA